MIDRIIEALDLLIIGMGGVFLILLAFSIMIWLLKTIDKKVSKSKDVPPVMSPQKEFFESRPESELIAVITAAAMMTLGKKIRVKKIHFLKEHQDVSWTSVARVNIMASHKIK